MVNNQLANANHPMSGEFLTDNANREGHLFDRRPFVVAGPCSVESEQQLSEVVAALQSIPEVAMVRCGVWKPRTRPGGFEGLGEQALQWIAGFRQHHPECRLPFCCEVATPEHAQLSLRYGMDALWIGARTTANPFMVQELATALRDTHIPLMVKNPPNPDVKLWLGAVERLRQAGCTEVCVIHRGFDIYKHDGYRNSPLWELPIELRRLMPDLPVFCDPSHIAGCTSLLLPISQTALDLGFDGLMIECHPNPSVALTDASQQVDPRQLSHLLAQIQVRHVETEQCDETLHLLREQIDALDTQLLHLLSDRQDISRQIAQIKATANMAVLQPKRWNSLLVQRINMARQLGLDEDYVKSLFEKIHTESIRQQEHQMLQ